MIPDRALHRQRARIRAVQQRPSEVAAAMRGNHTDRLVVDDAVRAVGINEEKSDQLAGSGLCEEHELRNEQALNAGVKLQELVERDIEIERVAAEDLERQRPDQ